MLAEELCLASDITRSTLLGMQEFVSKCIPLTFKATGTPSWNTAIFGVFQATKPFDHKSR